MQKLQDTLADYVTTGNTRTGPGAVTISRKARRGKKCGCDFHEEKAEIYSDRERGGVTPRTTVSGPEYRSPGRFQPGTWAESSQSSTSASEDVRMYRNLEVEIWHVVFRQD